MSEQSMDKEDRVKRRNKPSLSCFSCRKKKVKCDRKQPCSSCEKSHIGASCEYQITAQLNLRRRVSGNKNQTGLPGIQDYPTGKDSQYRYNSAVGIDDTINFYEGFTPVVNRSPFIRINSGPFAWFTLVIRDPWNRELVKKIATDDVKNYTSQIGQQLVSMTPVNKTLMKNKEVDEEKRSIFGECTFQTRGLKGDGYNDVIPYKLLSQNTIDKQKESGDVQPAIIQKCLSEGSLASELRLIERIKSIMPKKRVIWLLIDRFFASVYPLMPYVDEVEFTDKVTKILGSRSYEDSALDDLNIAMRLDLATVALCLIILRITYLSLFPNNKGMENPTSTGQNNTAESENLRYLLNNTVGIIMTETAQECLNAFDTKRNLKDVLQAEIFFRIYSNLAPEEGDFLDGGDSQMSAVVLIKKAQCLGLNREPNNFPEYQNELRANHLGRKTWCFLELLDISLCFMNGNFTSIRRNGFDVKKPYYEDGVSNVVDVELERITLKCYTWCDTLTVYLRDISDVVMDINGRVLIDELLGKLNRLEELCQDRFFIFSEVFREEMAEVSEKCRRYCMTFRTKIFLNIYPSLLIVYHFLFLHFVQKDDVNSSFRMIEKIFYLLNECICPIIKECFIGELNRDGYFFNHSMLAACHKPVIMIFSIALRVEFYLKTLKNAEVHENLMSVDKGYESRYNSLSKLMRAVMKMGVMFVSLENLLSRRYYYAWRISRAHKLLLDMVFAYDYTQMIPDHFVKINGLKYDSARLDILTDHLNNAHSKLEKIFHEVVPPSVPIEPKKSELFIMHSFQEKKNQIVDRITKSLKDKSDAIALEERETKNYSSSRQQAATTVDNAMSKGLPKENTSNLEHKMAYENRDSDTDSQVQDNCPNLDHDSKNMGSVNPGSSTVNYSPDMALNAGIMSGHEPLFPFDLSQNVFATNNDLIFDETLLDLCWQTEPFDSNSTIADWFSGRKDPM